MHKYINRSPLVWWWCDHTYSMHGGVGHMLHVHKCHTHLMHIACHLSTIALSHANTIFNSCTHPAPPCSIVACSVLCQGPLQLREPQEAAHQHDSMHCNTACSHDGDEGFAQWLGAADGRQAQGKVERDSLLQFCMHQFRFKLSCALNQQLLIYIYTLLLLYWDDRYTMKKNLYGGGCLIDSFRSTHKWLNIILSACTVV